MRGMNRKGQQKKKCMHKQTDKQETNGTSRIDDFHSTGDQRRKEKKKKKGEKPTINITKNPPDGRPR